MVDWLKHPFQSSGNEESNKIPFLNNIGKKVLALVIAISLWLVANLQHDIEKNIVIDVNYANLPPGLIVVNNPPEKLKLRVIELFLEGFFFNIYSNFDSILTCDLHKRVGGAKRHFNCEFRFLIFY